MSLLIESIKLLDGKYHNLFYHEQRMLRALDTLCGMTEDFNLEAFLAGLDAPQKGLYKCRIVYDDMSKEVEFLPYEPRPVTSLRVVENDRISYDHKYADRKKFEKMFSMKEGADDILIVKKGLVTDSSYANIAFRRGREWFTPWSALLKGTQRQKLIDSNKLIVEEIRVDDIRSFDAFKLMNAMVEFDLPEVDVDHIVF